MAAATSGPWKAAVAGGTAVGAANLGLELLDGNLTIAGPLSLGLAVFFLIGSIGALWRRDRDRTRQWALKHPWTYALAPAAGTGGTVFATRLLLGADGIFASCWHGLSSAAAVLVIVGIVSYVARAVRH